MIREKAPVKEVTKDEKCPINEYLKSRINDLEIEAEHTLNPLDRLEVRARIDELEFLTNFLNSSKPVQKFLKAIFCDVSKDDDDDGSNGKA